jgi:hypothetical protein
MHFVFLFKTNKLVAAIYNLAFFYYYFFCTHRRRMLPPPLVQRHVERHGHIQRVVRPVHGDVD